MLKKYITDLKHEFSGYNAGKLLKDILSGITVAAVALPLRQAGKKRGEAFLAGVLSGAVEPLFGVAAALAAVQVRPLMPWLLSFAAGAMLCVTAEELIPRAGGRDGTCAFLVGFLLMMALDVGLG